MKILHTADWHIGKQLHSCGLAEDHTFFLDWLAELIRERQIDLLLVSGDVFDTAYPTPQSLRLYYRFLTQLLGTGCQVIITGGNHDSPAVLNAPRELLHHLNIKIVGNALENIADQLIRIESPNGEVVVAAVPYLRDIDLRKSVSGAKYDDRVAILRQGIKQHYQQLADLHQAQYKGLCAVAMGHLYVNGATISESEREIHAIGGQAAFSSEHFPDGFDYVALGHIHKPQRIANSDFIRYSGSPLPLSFSERDDTKFVLELSLQNTQITQIEALPVPVFRQLRSFSGNLDQVEAALKAFAPQTRLESLVEIHVTEPNFDPQIDFYFNQFKQDFGKENFKIIKGRLSYVNRLQGVDELFATGTSIQDLSAREVFAKRLEVEKLDDETRQLLLEAFEEIEREVNEQH